MAVKIVIADDHVMFREGLKQILELDEKIRVVAEASDGAECIEVLQNARQESEPDVLLLDIAMPGMNGFQVVDVLKKSGNVIPILILTASNEMDYLIHAIDLGVDGYLLKECGTDNPSHKQFLRLWMVSPISNRIWFLFYSRP